MKVPISWLNEFVRINDIQPSVLAHDMANIGFEVESIDDMRSRIQGVVVGRILNISPHPNADKLQVVLVDVGSATLNIVTGAPNVFEGMLVPVALDGAVLYSGKIISKGMLRDVLSEGMLCSAGELGITSDLYDGDIDSGIMSLPKSKLGTDLRDVYGFNDTVLDIAITANRPDCQSIYGIAREVATLYKKSLVPLNVAYKSISDNTHVDVKILNETCMCYLGNIVRNIKVGKSVDIIRQRLYKVGIRSINSIVDITNYVLVEIGQPMHAFDYEYIKDGIVIRAARDGETIKALDDKMYTLNDNMCVISNNTDTLAVAGVIGGESSAIRANTKHMFFESAFFEKSSVRTTSRSLGIRTDSSARFEKGVNIGLQRLGLNRALHLISKYKIGDIASSGALVVQESKPRVIKFDIGQIYDVLGITVPLATVQKILSSLDIKIKAVGGKLSAVIPEFRDDIEGYPDIAEEIIRFYGYDKLVPTLLPNTNFTIGGTGVRYSNMQDIRQMLVAKGYNEITTYSFVSSNIIDKLLINSYTKEYNPIAILNPISSEYSHMRTMLASGMLDTIASNNNHKNKNYTLYELGRAYISSGDNKLPSEIDKLCIGSSGGADFYDVKDSIERLLAYFGVEYTTVPSSELEFVNSHCVLSFVVGGHAVGFVAEIHPLVLESFDIHSKVILAELDISALLQTSPRVVKVSPISKYPEVCRDIALIVREDILARDIVDAIKGYASSIVKSINIFDVYKGEQVPSGYKSVAVALSMWADYTLKDSDINSAVQDILDGLERDNIARIRDSAT